jgi:hypothetical protein
LALGLATLHLGVERPGTIEIASLGSGLPRGLDVDDPDQIERGPARHA